MNKERQIEKFINRSIKIGGEFSNEAELQLLIEQMTTEEISMFWFRFISSKVFSETSANIPHWKTTDQEKFFELKRCDFTFYPKEKDSNGKYIIDRNEFIKHIVGHITTYIKDKIQRNINFKNSSLLDKLPFYTVVSTLIMIPIFIICFIFQKNQICNSIILFCYILYGLNILFYCMARYILNKRHRKQFDKK
ncbi:MAG: hypothetical protein WCJ62_05995 [Flavobacterium sp.]